MKRRSAMIGLKAIAAGIAMAAEYATIVEAEILTTVAVDELPNAP
jgi:hypothetical protein